MLSYDNCPNGLPCMPEFATIDGVKFIPDENAISTLFYNKDELCGGLVVENQVEAISSVILPTLTEIGLLPALLELESVLAWNQTEKHPNSKWKSKTISWHDSKAISHLNWSQCGVLKDEETGRSHRAHAAARLLMSLAHELKND